MTTDSLAYLDYSIALQVEEFRLLQKEPKELSQLGALTRPFSTSVCITSGKRNMHCNLKNKMFIIYRCG